LLAVVDHIAEVFENGIFGPASEGSSDPVDEIFTILDLYRQQLNDGGFTFGSPMASLSAEVSENHPPVRDRLAEIFAAWSGRIEELLRNAGNRLPSSLDRTSLAQFVVCTMEGAVLGTRLNRNLAAFDAAIGQLRIYLDLLESRSELSAAVPATSTAASVSRSQSADWRSW
jgi:TetR/AcrR family transcriptional repressor of nem operon